MKFSTEQVNNILAQEQDEYIWELTHKFKNDKRLILPDEQMDDLFNRLKDAHSYLMELGFSRKVLIETFLCAEATTPGNKDNPNFKSWIEKPNEIPEKQFEDLLRVTTKIQQK